jgi:hypothetical protein
MSRHLAVTQNRKASLAADRGESATPYHPSNSSSVSSAKSGPSFVESPQPVTPSHSRHRAKASEHYSKNTVEATFVRPSSTKRTRAEHLLNNQEDFSEKGHKL